MCEFERWERRRGRTLREEIEARPDPAKCKNRNKSQSKGCLGLFEGRNERLQGAEDENSRPTRRRVDGKGRLVPFDDQVCQEHQKKYISSQKRLLPLPLSSKNQRETRSHRKNKSIAESTSPMYRLSSIKTASVFSDFRSKTSMLAVPSEGREGSRESVETKRSSERKDAFSRSLERTTDSESGTY